MNIALYDNGSTTAILIPLDQVPSVNNLLANNEVEFWDPFFSARNPDDAIIVALSPICEVAKALGILTLPTKSLNS